MGTWGTEVFDNDTALDYLGNVVQRIIDDIREDLATLDNGDLARVTPAAASLLVGIALQLPDARFSLSKQLMNSFRSTYLQWFDANMHATGADAQVLCAYRDSVDRVFIHLTELAEGRDSSFDGVPASD